MNDLTNLVHRCTIHNMNEKFYLDPENETVESYTLYAIHRMARAIMMRVDGELESVGLSGAKMWALVQLMESEEPLGVSQLAQCMGSGKSNATQLIDRMEADDIVRRVPDEHDRRRVRVEITEEGFRRIRGAHEIRKRVATEVISVLEPHERASLRAYMEKIAESLDTDIF